MRMVRCPRCGADVVWEEAKYRPFCSERCKLIDLGEWLGERYAIPGEPVPDSETSNDEEPE